MLVRQKPSARVITLEVLIMLVNNKTADWVHRLEPSKREELMQEARSISPGMLLRYKEKMAQIKQDKWKIWQGKQAQREEKQRKQAIERLQLIDSVDEQGGLWRSKERIEQEYKKMEESSDEQIRRAIHKQLQFHQKVLQVKASKRELYQLTITVDGKQKKISKETMKENLIKIVELGHCGEGGEHREKPSTSRTFTSPSKRLSKFTEMKENLAAKRAKEKTKRAVQNSKQHLEALLKNPKLLVGKKN